MTLKEIYKFLDECRRSGIIVKVEQDQLSYNKFMTFTKGRIQVKILLK